MQMAKLITPDDRLCIKEFEQSAICSGPIHRDSLTLNGKIKTFYGIVN